MSVKECGHHEEEQRKLRRRIFSGLLAFIILILFVIFVIYIILRPSKPHFVLQDVTVLAFNASTTPNSLLTTNIQVTLSSRNPNERIGVYYEKLDIFATYRSQQITLPTLLPVTYQGHRDVVVWSPVLYGNSAPVAPFLSELLRQDLIAGLVLLNVKIDGRVKWKVGTWFSGPYHIHVNCPAYISTGRRKDGIDFGPTVKYQLVQSCTVDV